MAGKHSAPPQTPQPNLSRSAAPSDNVYAAYAKPRKRRGGCLAAFLVLLLVAAGVAAAFYFFVANPRHYEVTINGQAVTVERDATLADVIEAGYATPAPGDLLAIDGSVATPGGGEAFAATVNGTATTDPATTLARDAVVEIADGADLTETFTVTEEAVPHGSWQSDTGMNTYWTGSLHVNVPGEDGVVTKKTGDVSGIVQTEQTKAPVDGGYHVYTANVGTSKKIALTFDDGPWGETTDAILDVLEANGAKATFFTIGNQISSHTDQIQRAHALGCLVCTHTWDHASGSGQGVNLTYMSPDEQIWEIQQGYAAIKEALGEEPAHILRAPGGNYYGDIITTLAPYVDAEVGWDVDTEDWRLPGSDVIYQRIMSVQPGQVILMHDGGGDRTQTVEAVRRAVPELVAQGYELVTVSELLAPEYVPTSGDGAINVG